VILFLAVVVRLPLVDLEFGRNGDGTGSFYGMIARNYLLRDNLPTLWVPVLSIGDANHPPTLYAHHPPTVPLLTALSMRVFGDTDFAVRLPATFFTLATVVLLYLLVLSGSGPLAAATAAAVFAFVPFTLRFGQMPDVVNSQLAFAALLTLGAYLHWLAAPSRGRAALVLLAFVAAGLTDWPAFFLVPVIGAHLLVARPRGYLTFGVALAAASALLFCALYLWVSVATGDWQLILRQFLNRATQAKTDDARVFSHATWFSGVWAYHRVLFTPTLMVLGLVGVVVAAVSRERSRGIGLLVLLATAWAVVHAVVGRQGTLNHDWWWWPLAPALALAVAALVDSIANRFPRRAVTALLATAVLALCTYFIAIELPLLRSPAWVHGAIPEYTPKQLGAVIRAHTPPNRAAMLFETDPQPYAYYNADRPLIQAVWDIPTFHTRFTGTRADLFYNFDQALPQPPTTFIFPKQYADKGLPLLQYLRDHHPVTDTPQFYVFDLTRPAAR